MNLTQMMKTTMMMIHRAKARTSLSIKMATSLPIRPLSEGLSSEDATMILSAGLTPIRLPQVATFTNLRQVMKFNFVVCNKLLGACVLVHAYLAFIYFYM